MAQLSPSMAMAMGAGAAMAMALALALAVAVAVGLPNESARDAAMQAEGFAPHRVVRVAP